jgi:hypothetical protein
MPTQSPAELTIVEVPFSRESFGGDTNAINRHSVRRYVDSDGCEFSLDRTLDASPPFFSLWSFPVATNHPWLPALGESVPVDGADCFGDGWSWQQAETAALAAIRSLGSENSV